MARNACVFLVNKRGYVMMLKCRSTRLWMTPGGRVEHKESAWEGMLREFEEETRCSLSVKDCSLLQRGQWRDTAVFVLRFDYRMPHRFQPTNETVARRFVHYTELIDSPRVKSYVKKSFDALRIAATIERHCV